MSWHAHWACTPKKVQAMSNAHCLYFLGCKERCTSQKLKGFVTPSSNPLILIALNCRLNSHLSGYHCCPLNLVILLVRCENLTWVWNLRKYYSALFVQEKRKVHIKMFVCLVFFCLVLVLCLVFICFVLFCFLFLFSFWFGFVLFCFVFLFFHTLWEMSTLLNCMSDLWLLKSNEKLQGHRP